MLKDINDVEWQLRSMILGNSISELIKVISEIQISDFLNESTFKSISNFALENNLNKEKLERIMMTAANLGLFEVNKSKDFRLTPMGCLLRKDQKGSLRNYSILKGQNWGKLGVSGLKASLKEQTSAFEIIHGENFFKFLDNENQTPLYNNSIHEISQYHDSYIVNNYDFSKYNNIMDIGAGYGSLLREITTKYPNVKAYHFEAENVFVAMKQLNLLDIFQKRCEFIQGDFFKDKLIECDLYILKTILHDWSDDKAIKILKNIRNSMPDTGKLLVVEILPQENETIKHSLMDLEMLLYYGGRERAVNEYEELAKNAELFLSKIIFTGSDITILEFSPI